MIGKRYEIIITGKGNKAAFLRKLSTTKAKIFQLSNVEDCIRFYTDKEGVRQIRKIRKRYDVQVKISSVEYKNGTTKILSSYYFLIACVIPLCASLFLWTIEIESTMPEVTDRIDSKLKSASIVPFTPLTKLPDEKDIRQLLMLDDPSLSWVRFKRVGTKLTIIPMLSPISSEAGKERSKPSHLVARTAGVITRFELKSGERVGRIHQTVRKGELLASGILEQGNKTTVVGAEGSVYANYWVEYSFSLPRKISYRSQGDETVRFRFHNPLDRKSKSVVKDNPKKKWSLFSLDRSIDEVKRNLTIKPGMEETLLAPLLKEQVLSEKNDNVVIVEEKILHVTFDNDKVEGTILFQLNDNIAIKKPIPQGD